MPQRLQKLKIDLASDDAEVVAKALDELAGLRTAEAAELLFEKACDEAFSAAKLASNTFSAFVAAHPKIALRHTSSDLRKSAIAHLSSQKVIAAVPELRKRSSAFLRITTGLFGWTRRSISKVPAGLRRRTARKFCGGLRLADLTQRLLTARSRSTLLSMPLYT